MRIWKYLESRMNREIDAMPYNLSKRQVNKLVTKALKKVGRKKKKRFGIERPHLQALVDMFFFTNYSFPSFPNEAYISMLKGEEAEIVRIGEINENGNFEMYN